MSVLLLLTLVVWGPAKAESLHHGFKHTCTHLREGQETVSSYRPREHFAAAGRGSRSATACMHYKMAAASLPPPGSHTGASLGLTLSGNIQERGFWDMEFSLARYQKPPQP